ncbi:hypothetical protein EON66_09485 [archaeon]|nr:MAG: hypothetical protein EON66_09485 [archaeon]
MGCSEKHGDVTAADLLLLLLLLLLLQCTPTFAPAAPARPPFRRSTTAGVCSFSATWMRVQ